MIRVITRLNGLNLVNPPGEISTRPRTRSGPNNAWRTAAKPRTLSRPACCAAAVGGHQLVQDLIEDASEAQRTEGRPGSPLRCR